MIFSSVSSFCKIKGYRLCICNLASGLPQLGRKLEKWEWCHNFSPLRNRQFFSCCFVSLMKFRYWSKFHVNVIYDSGVMTIFFFKGLTRNPKIRNTPVWTFPNTCRLEKVENTNFGIIISNKILLNAAKCQGYSF